MNIFQSAKPKKIIIAVDIRRKLNCYVQGAMGNYASAISVTCDAMQYAMFIPPASPAIIQTIGVLTVNGTMQLCSSYYSNTISKSIIKEQLKSMVI